MSLSCLGPLEKVTFFMGHCVVEYYTSTFFRFRVPVISRIWTIPPLLLPRSRSHKMSNINIILLKCSKCSLRLPHSITIMITDYRLSCDDPVMEPGVLLDPGDGDQEAQCQEDSLRPRHPRCPLSTL